MSRQLVRLEIGDVVEHQGSRFILSAMIVNGGRRRVVFAPLDDADEEVSPDVAVTIQKYLEAGEASSRIASRRNARLDKVREVLLGQGLDGVTADSVIAGIIDSGFRFRQRG